jgi:hypothetical protein
MVLFFKVAPFLKQTLMNILNKKKNILIKAIIKSNKDINSSWKIIYKKIEIWRLIKNKMK